jgi:hypothetical protein
MKLNCEAQRHHYSTCPQCLEAGARQIELFDSQLNDYANSTHYAWQAGVHLLKQARMA